MRTSRWFPTRRVWIFPSLPTRIPICRPVSKESAVRSRASSTVMTWSPLIFRRAIFSSRLICPDFNPFNCPKIFVLFPSCIYDLNDNRFMSLKSIFGGSIPKKPPVDVISKRLLSEQVIRKSPKLQFISVFSNIPKRGALLFVGGK